MPSSVPLPVGQATTDVATCHQFATEQAGHMSADQFNRWLLSSSMGGWTVRGAQDVAQLNCCHRRLRHLFAHTYSPPAVGASPAPATGQRAEMTSRAARAAGAGDLLPASL